MIKSIFMQSPKKFYPAVPIFWQEISKLNLFDKLYVVTDYKGNYNLDERCKVIYRKKDGDFGTNMLYGLSEVDEDIFLICCEDHIIKSETDPSDLVKCFNIMEKNKEIGFLRLTNHKKVPLKNKNEFVSSINRKYKYYISLQAAIWRKEYFKKSLAKGDTCWNFEIRGSNRVRKLKNMMSYGCNRTVFCNTNFFSKGKYYRRQYIDYLLSHNMPLPNDGKKVYHRKNPIPLDEYIKIYKENHREK